MNLRVFLLLSLVVFMLAGGCRIRQKYIILKRRAKQGKPMARRSGGDSEKRSTFFSGRSFLSKGNKEKKNYGIYSYILFPQRPDSSNYQVYSQVIRAYLNKVENVDDIERYVQRIKVNIVYFPVKGPIEELQHIKGEEERTNWLINNYDYARAKFFISKIQKENLYKGPYIVSCKESLSDCKPLKKDYLLQDLSHVHQKVVSLWVSEFLKQSSDLNYWDDTSVDNFTNEIRNAIAIGADGLQIVNASMDWWLTNLTDWIELK